MNKVEVFILNIIRKIETLKTGLISFGYLDGNDNNSHVWYCICLSDYEIYSSDKRFKALSKAWYAAAKSLGVKIAFAYCNPIEERLVKLAENDNLFLNV